LSLDICHTRASFILNEVIFIDARKERGEDMERSIKKSSLHGFLYLNLLSIQLLEKCEYVSINLELGQIYLNILTPKLFKNWLRFLVPKTLILKKGGYARK
jgi:hypothetical protein